MCDKQGTGVTGGLALGSLVGMLAEGLASGVIAMSKSKTGRKVMFWGLAMPMFLSILWTVFGWWLVVAAVALLAAAVAVLAAVRRAGQGAISAEPKVARRLQASGVRAVAIGAVPEPALPRAMQQELTGQRVRVIQGHVLPAGERIRS